MKAWSKPGCVSSYVPYVDGTYRMMVVCPKDVLNATVELCATNETGLKVASTHRCSPGSSTPKPSAG